MNYYKTLVNGRSFHGGEFEYSLPKNGKPGKWHKITKPLLMCEVGFHVTSEPANWWHKDAQCYLVEYRGEVIKETGSNKICVAEVRLVREVDPADVQIFYAGSHVVGSGKCLAYDSVTVEAYGSATVKAYGSATVKAYDSVTVEAYGSVTVEAYGSVTVKAYDSATVKAFNSVTVEAYNSVTVEACNSVTVEACNSVTVEAYDSATVNKWRLRSVVTLHNAAIEIDRTTSPPTIRGNYQEAV